MKKLTGEQARALRKQAACPDCASEVTVDRRTRRVQIHHDDTCPTLARLQRHGGTTSLMIARAPGQSPEDFADDVAEVAREVAAETGITVRLRTGPYDGLPPL